MRGLYIHIPFCVRKCSYCDFYSLPGRLECLESYIQAVVGESRKYSGLSFQTLYLGGGTPSLLGGRYLKELIDGISQNLDLTGLVEATIEANPESTTRELLTAAKGSGITRVSLGVQSLADDELMSVGRVHTARQAVEAIGLAQNTGFKSISADLIIGLPGQTWQSLNNSLDKLSGLDIQHLSVYCLSLEEGTPQAKNPPVDLLSDDMQADLFEKAVSLLTRHGFIHYEISNLALKGYECQHNINYWQGGEYLGLGPAAASHLGGKRFRNKPDLDAYLGDPTGQVEYVEELGNKDKAAEEAILRLRLLEEGIEPDELIARFGQPNVQDIIARLDNMVTIGQLIFENSRYRLHPSRILTSNPIFSRVLSG